MNDSSAALSRRDQEKPRDVGAGTQGAIISWGLQSNWFRVWPRRQHDHSRSSNSVAALRAHSIPGRRIARLTLAPADDEPAGPTV